MRILSELHSNTGHVYVKFIGFSFAQQTQEKQWNKLHMIVSLIIIFKILNESLSICIFVHIPAMIGIKISDLFFVIKIYWPTLIL